MKKTIKVKYSVEVELKDFNRALKSAQEKGYDHSDAGPTETVRRSLVAEGMYGTFPEEQTNRRTFN